MTKQKEISRWFCKYLAQFNGQLDYGRLPQHRKDTYKMMVEEDIMPYLHSQGVVINLPTGESLEGCVLARLEPLIGGK